MKKLSNFIAGEWINPTNNSYREILSPISSEFTLQIPNSEFLDVVKGVQAGNKGFPNWSQLEIKERAEYLQKYAAVLEQSAPELTESLLKDAGWPVHFGSSLEISQAIKALRDFIDMAIAEASELNRNSSRLPIGVVAIITGQAQPIHSLIFRLAPALLMGNCIIWKPSSGTARTSELLAEISRKAQWPAGIFNLIFGQGESLGEALIQHPGISTLAFNGQTSTGLKVLKATGENAKKTQLSLGAKNASIVFADADLTKVMPLIVQNAFDFQTTGALRGSRIFVQESIYKNFLEAFKIETEKLVSADPHLPSTRLGPVFGERQKASFERLVQQSLSETGKLLVGEKNPSSLYIQPTAVFDLSFCSTVHQEELDAPFVTISSFKYAHDAVKQVNTSPFGQAAFVWSADRERVAKFASKLEVGRVFFNQMGFLDAKRSFIAAKNSGFGAEGGKASFDFFSRRVEIIA